MTTLLTLFFLFLGCGEKSDDTSTTASGYECPTVQEDSCMTEELYQECLDVVESCESGNIVVAESCPYASFGCME
jgi:nitrogenase subunit NifH